MNVRLLLCISMVMTSTLMAIKPTNKRDLIEAKGLDGVALNIEDVDDGDHADIYAEELITQMNRYPSRKRDIAAASLDMGKKEHVNERFKKTARGLV